MSNTIEFVDALIPFLSAAAGGSFVLLGTYAAHRYQIKRAREERTIEKLERIGTLALELSAAAAKLMRAPTTMRVFKSIGLEQPVELQKLDNDELRMLVRFYGSKALMDSHAAFAREVRELGELAGEHAYRIMAEAKNGGGVQEAMETEFEEQCIARHPRVSAAYSAFADAIAKEMDRYRVLRD